MHGHLNKVAHWAGKFAEEMFPAGSEDSKTAREWGRLAGLWHDLGKFSEEFQDYLAKAGDPHNSEVSGRIDHSTAGGNLVRDKPPFGDLLSYIIAGHHAGLDDGVNLFPPGKRFDKKIPAWHEAAVAAGVPLEQQLPLPPLTRPDSGNDGMAFLLRIFFSCLVDADFLATEAFMTS